MFKKKRLSAAVALAFGGSAMFGSGSALAQDTAQRIEITGSSIKRIEAETALPVQVITRKEIERSGVSNVEQLLQNVSAAASGGALMASSASGATTGGISSVSLRGLTSLRTLVLVNGRRIAPYGVGFIGDSVSVDVNSIPLAAVERVEVLKEGASAIYGSDAIAGVINFILRKDYTGGEVVLTYGDSTQGGASVKNVTATVGFGDLAADRFNLMLMGSLQKEGALFGRDRAFAGSSINEAALNDTTSGNTFPANVFIPVRADGIEGNPLAPACPGPFATLDPLIGPGVCRFDPAPMVTLLPATERASIFAVGKVVITNSMEGFIEASFTRSKQRTIIQPVPLSDQFALPDNHPLFGVYPYTIPETDPVFGPYIASGALNVTGRSTFVLNPSSPYYPTAFVAGQTGGPTPPILVRYRAASTGMRDFTDISEAPRLTLGVRGTAAGWDYDAGVLWSQSKVRERVNGGYPSLTTILPLLNSGVVNPFGPSAPDVEAALAASFLGDAFKVKSTLSSVAAKGSRELVQLRGGPLALALGAEFRKEDFLFDPSPAIQTGDISGYGGNFLTTDRSRNVKAAFGELGIPVFKSLEFTGSLRVDNYEGVGTSTTPKIGARYQPTRQVMFRGSWGKGFRAPSLQDLYLPNTTGVTLFGLSDPLRCPVTNSSLDCATQFPVTLGGNPDLKPERSKNTTLGVVVEPVNNLSIALDYFRIDLTDTIDNGIDPNTILADPDRYAALITRGPSVGGLPGPITNISQINLNIGRTKVSGFDIDARASWTLGPWGRFGASFTGTYFSRYDTQNLDGSFTSGIDQVNQRTGGIVPRWKHRLAIDWTQGPWVVTLAQNFQKAYNDVPGTFEDPDDPAFVARRVDYYQTFDARVGYTGVKNMTLALGVRNLFDRDPPYSNAGGQLSFQAGYDPQYADPKGRFIYATLSYRFK